MKNFLTFLFVFSIFSVMTVSCASVGFAAQDKDGELTAKQQGIVTIAAFTAQGDLEKLKGALSEGLEKGLTVNEIKEVLIQMYAYCGFPRSLNAINTFMSVMEERAAKGIKDEMGPEAGPLPTGKTKERMGHENRASLVGGEFPPRGYALFVPTIDLFLKEHLFADIFGRDNLDYSSREIATVAALSTLGVPAQLRSHLNICLTVGVNEAKLNHLISILNDKVGKKEADEAEAELKNILKSKAK